MSIESSSGKEIKAKFFAGATSTVFSTRGLVDDLAGAYGRNKISLEPSIISRDPPKRGNSSVANYLEEHSGEKVHLIVHSSGAGQFARGLTEQRRRKARVDMSQMTIVSIETPRDAQSLFAGMRRTIGPEGQAVDSFTAFPADPNVLPLHIAEEGVRRTLSGFRQDIEGLNLVKNSWGGKDYHGDLDVQTAARLSDLDGAIAAAFNSEDPRSKALLFKRGQLLWGKVQDIYHGKSSAERPPNDDERAQGGLGNVLRGAVLLGPTVASRRPWSILKELHGQYIREEGGPRVVTVIPEYGQLVSPGDAEQLYGSRAALVQHAVALEGLTHSGMVLTKGVYTGIRSKVIDTDPRMQ